MKRSIRLFFLTIIAAFSMVVGSAINNSSNALNCNNRGCLDTECSPDDRICFEHCAPISGLNCTSCGSTTQC